MELIPYDKKSNWEKLLYFLIAFIYQRRGQDEHNKLLKIAENTVTVESRKEEVEKMGKTMAQVLIERGMEEGMEKGKREGLYDAISLGLELRFGVDSLWLMEKVMKIEPIERLKLIRESIRTNKSF